METHENPDVRPENEGDMPQREDEGTEGAPTFDEQQRTPAAERAGESSDEPAEQTPKP
ncbi:MAG TPA: hypothetical protein VG474_03220 [Solirubrobacteraceae bacterium]|nr:hypothetical protein [Solirubrobacteraceae bacterium]